ncbi:hypothetical protein E6O75_ATG07469 [Venturia nashicola]|uniref:Uncharacterized protein n=1 Tax=Venturia nashicola TaxID=86259 RepID=A0A4Z1NXT9_9PEZI|nr:hypothetical protein E6O75_ATG07469 [Venturia nashicola]
MTVINLPVAGEHKRTPRPAREAPSAATTPQPPRTPVAATAPKPPSQNASSHATVVFVTPQATSSGFFANTPTPMRFGFTDEDDERVAPLPDNHEEMVTLRKELEQLRAQMQSLRTDLAQSQTELMQSQADLTNRDDRVRDLERAAALTLASRYRSRIINATLPLAEQVGKVHEVGLAIKVMKDKAWNEKFAGDVPGKQTQPPGFVEPPSSNPSSGFEHLFVAHRRRRRDERTLESIQARGKSYQEHPQQISHTRRTTSQALVYFPNRDQTSELGNPVKLQRRRAELSVSCERHQGKRRRCCKRCFWDKQAANLLSVQRIRIFKDR